MTSLETLGNHSLKIHLRVADQLGLAILRGDFPPGDVLPPERKLCEMLGVSRTAMRAWRCGSPPAFRRACAPVAGRRQAESRRGESPDRVDPPRAGGSSGYGCRGFQGSSLISRGIAGGFT